MYTLSDYVDSLFELAADEKNKARRNQIVEAWFKMLKRHHRDLEGKKIFKFFDNKVKALSKKAQVSVSDEKEQNMVIRYFQDKNVPIELEIKPELLGGTRIVWDNMLFDNTISGQLDKLKDKFAK